MSVHELRFNIVPRKLTMGGAQGPNLLKLARKEQCLALLTQLRSKFKLNGQFYRVFPNGEVFHFS